MEGLTRFACTKFRIDSRKSSYCRLKSENSSKGACTGSGDQPRSAAPDLRTERTDSTVIASRTAFLARPFSSACK